MVGLFKFGGLIMDTFMQLVKQMREAQKEAIALRQKFYTTTLDETLGNMAEAIELNSRLERLQTRVDEEIAAAERQELANDPDCIRMANGQKLVQGNLFEDQ